MQGYSSKIQTKVTSSISDTQKQNIKNLKKDLTTLKSESGVTTEQKLKSDLFKISQSATRPDPETVDQLSVDFQNATSDGSISKIEKAKLIQDTQKVLESANISSKDIQMAISDVEEIFETSNIDQTDIDMIIQDL